MRPCGMAMPPPMPVEPSALALDQTVEQTTLVELQTRWRRDWPARPAGPSCRTSSRWPERPRDRSANQRFPQLHQWVSEREHIFARRGVRPYRRVLRAGQATPCGGHRWGLSRPGRSRPATPRRRSACDAGRLRLMPRRPRRRRSADDGMRMASRYLATVRRAISMPSPFSRSTMRSSDKRLVRTLAADQKPDARAHRLRRHDHARRARRQRRGEEILELEDAARRGDVLVRGDAAHRALVQLGGDGDVAQHQRLAARSRRGGRSRPAGGRSRAPPSGSWWRAAPAS